MRARLCRPRAGPARSWVRAYAAVWCVTLASAVVVAVAGPGPRLAVRRVLGLALTAAGRPPSVGHVLALTAHNIPIAAWPVLVGLTGASRHRLWRHVADSLVLACLLANTLPVGAALGAYGTPLIAYIPQLPIEWAGLALGYGAWLVERERSVGARERLGLLAAIACSLLCAATLESVAAPHR